MTDYTFGIGDELQFASQDGDLIHTWDFGDGSAPSSLPSPSHAYTVLGIYTVTHTAKDFCDTCLNIGSHTVQIADASITVKSLLLDKYSINIGDIVTATIIVQNMSLVYGTGTVTLKFAGQTIDIRNVNLNSREETSYTVIYQAIRSGTISVCADNICTVLFVESMISVVSITPNPVISTGEAINAVVEAKNNGTFTEEKEIRTTLTNSNNQVTIEDTRLVNLIAGETQTYTVPIDVRTLPNGVYVICADGMCKAVSVAIPAPTGSLNVTSYPDNADIFLDGNNTGFKTPATITDILAGDHNFKISLPNYNDTVGTITILGGITSYIYTALSPTSPTTGSLSVQSIPTGAEIFLAQSGQPLSDQGAITPATITDLTPENYDILLRLSGYQDYTITTTIAAGQTSYISTILIPTPITIGSINFTTVPDGAEIWLDGNNTGRTTPNTITNIDIGNHSFTLVKDGYNNILGQTDVVGGITSYVYAVMVPIAPTVGGISITSTPPGADIYLDGNVQPVTTPATISNLTPGTHDITLKLSGYEDFTKSVNIIAGITIYLDTILTPIPITIGNINFTTIPDNVEIWLDGSNTGKTTPDILTNISIGPHTFILKLYGYNDTTGSITVIGGAISYIYAVMVPIAPTVGGISITSTPPGADIYIDGVPQLDINDQPIRTPATISNLTPGTHDITLKLSGYEDFTKSVNIIAGITIYLDTILTPIPITIGSINFESYPSGAEIWLDGSNTGRTTPDILTNISIGTHTFILKKSGYNNTTGPITVIGGAISYVYAILSITEAITGSLSISSAPTGADIYLDGNVQPVTTPATISNLTPGTHDITLKLSGYEDFNISTNIVVGQTSYISVSMTILPSTIGNINFTTVPDGAEIWLDGNNTGRTTPNTITNIDIGNHSFTLVKDGYNNILGQTDVVGGITSYVYAVMVPIAPTVGGISITSTPPGADIYIDGVPQLDSGNDQPIRTPATISNLTPRTHDITLKLSGYEDFTKSVNIIAGITIYLDTIITPIPITIGNINFTTIPDNVEIWLDGSNTGKTTPDILTNISIGTHTFILKKSGYDNTTGPITVIGGVASYIYAVMVPVSAITGSLSISSIPQNADIYLDGTLQLDNGQPLKTPATLINLDPGTYTIKLKKTGYIDFTTHTPIDIIAGQTSYLGVTLSTLQVMEAGMPWWFILSLATGTIYGMLQPKKEKEKIISKLGTQS